MAKIAKAKEEARGSYLLLFSYEYDLDKGVC